MPQLPVMSGRAVVCVFENLGLRAAGLIVQEFCD